MFYIHVSVSSIAYFYPVINLLIGIFELGKRHTHLPKMGTLPVAKYHMPFYLLKKVTVEGGYFENYKIRTAVKLNKIVPQPLCYQNWLRICAHQLDVKGGRLWRDRKYIYLAIIGWLQS
jgi:hypothetical protein